MEFIFLLRYADRSWARAAVTGSYESPPVAALDEYVMHQLYNGDITKEKRWQMKPL